jgi:hypothetical protein
VVTARLTFYVRDVLDRTTNSSIPMVRQTSRSLWDEHLRSVGKREKFTLNRFNYDAMADILLPRAVGYAAGFLDTFFRGSVGGSFEEQNLTISGSTEVMDGTFQLLYDTDDGTRRELASWALRIEANQPSQVVVAPQLPPDAGPTPSCWLIFRGQLGEEAGAVGGAKIDCPRGPTAPPEPQDRWVLYSCIYWPWAANGAFIRYSYATTDPPLANDGLAMPQFRLSPTSGEAVCSIRALAWSEQPPGSVTEHPF